MIRSNLKEMLDNRKMSIREFSKRIDYRFESVRQLYNSENKRIPVDLLEKACVELNCEVGELLTLQKNK
ncbi:helix-turn-helix domain-containing protein [Halobacillus yeomjeoni]|uniref:Helix-turn-helix transcriptional regulator n=1 Tax=Halobacillus yeomjeoni TaxID=311194 RepID=A0A931MVS9_9BACI|nr:helix-turn-helix transcriptional regulator [Halobacillus yeomjeoni]MBH0231388.1 helix-turn-helix transcriptional regulator [Halobacillus yeomjeoni]